MGIREILAKSVLSKSELPGCDYALNPYIGCMHSCVYCYARFMKRFTGHNEPWGHFVDVKVNAPQLLERELKKAKRGNIFLSSVTDPYLPLEQSYKITRECLKILVQFDFPLEILTKSDLVLRDIKVLKQIKNVDVGLSLSLLDEKVSKVFEPLASPPKRRVAALEKLHRADISTFAFISPIMPFFTGLEEIFKLLKGKVNFIGAENLNLYPNVCGNVDRILRRHFPEKLEKFRRLCRSPNYWGEVKLELKALSKTFNIPAELYFHD